MRITRRSAVIGASAIALATAGALVAGPAFARDVHRARGTFQTVDSSTATMPGFGNHDGFPGRGLGRGHGRGHGPEMGAFGPMLHSTGVIQRTESGTATYVTVSQQNGKVTAASDTALTVQSADGVSWTWTLTSSTKIVRNGAKATGSAFQVGDLVVIVGTGSGSGSTATFVMSHAPRPAAPSGSTAGGTLAPVPSSNA